MVKIALKPFLFIEKNSHTDAFSDIDTHYICQPAADSDVFNMPTKFLLAWRCNLKNNRYPVFRAVSGMLIIPLRQSW